MTSSGDDARGGGGASQRSPYAPCAEVLLAVARGQDAPAAASPLRAAHLRCEGGDAVMSPQNEHVVICTLRAASAVTRTLEGRRDMRHPKPGSFSVVPAGCSTRWQVHGASESLHLHIDAARVEEYMQQHDHPDRADAIQPGFALSDAWLDGFHHLLRAELRNAVASGASLHVFLGEAEHMLLRHLLRRLPGRRDGAGRIAPLRPYLVARIGDYVRAHLGSEITLGLLAGQVHMSPDHFLRAFSAAVGATPYRWVLQQRIDAAAHLLASTDRPVADIARDVGYRSASQFAAQFRHRYLATPAEYRRARQAGE